MGGRALKRQSDPYRNTVLLSKKLTEQGFTMLCGGGGGAMEATSVCSFLFVYSFMFVYLCSFLFIHVFVLFCSCFFFSFVSKSWVLIWLENLMRQ